MLCKNKNDKKNLDFNTYKIKILNLNKLIEQNRTLKTLLSPDYIEA